MKKICILMVMVLGFSVMYANSVIALPMQWEASSGGNDHWYDVVLLNPYPYLAWEDAMAAASAAGGYLATITSEEENTFVSSLLVTDDDPTRYWLGGYQTSTDLEPEGNWAWVTGEDWFYTKWTPGEPNNGMGGTQHYLHYWPTNGQWDDMENGRYMAGYIMETASIPEPATMLLFGTGLVGLVGARVRRKK